jgi:hypothetical protein
MVSAALLILTSGLPSQASLPPLADPPTLSSGEFKLAVKEVRRSLAAKDFEGASRLIAVLPRTEFVVKLDESTMPSEMKASAEAAIQDAARAFADSPFRGSLKVGVSDPDIKVSFTDLLPFIPGSKRRQAAVFFVSFAPGEPRVEAVIAIQRGLPLRPLDRRDIGAEVMHAIGLAMGMVRVPREGGMMGRVDAPVRIPLRVAPQEVLIGRANLEIVEGLRRRAAQKISEPLGSEPLARLERESLPMGTSIQGEEMSMTFQVTNQGGAPLQFSIVPDCSCFTLKFDPVVKPGGVNLVQVFINTRDFPGPLSKGLYFYSNDPDKSALRIDVTGHVTPVYRFLRSSAEKVILTPREGATTTLYLVYPSDRPFQVLGVEAAGAPVKVAWKPWEGVLADPEFDEAARSRVGYEITLSIPPRREPGRYPVSLQVRTSDPDFSQLAESLVVQTGIVASPSSVFMGRLTESPAGAWVEVSRPGRAFKITKVTSDTSLVSGEAEPQEDGTWRLRIRYLGKGPSGRLSAVLTLQTDDPDQPQVLVPVSGTVE